MRTGVAIQTSNYDWDNVTKDTKKHEKELKRVKKCKKMAKSVKCCQKMLLST